MSRRYRHLLRILRERAIGALCGAGGVIALVLALGWVGEQDYQDALAAEARAREYREHADRALRTAEHRLRLAESMERLQDMQRAERKGWR